MPVFSRTCSRILVLCALQTLLLCTAVTGDRASTIIACESVASSNNAAAVGHRSGDGVTLTEDGGLPPLASRQLLQALTCNTPVISPGPSVGATAPALEMRLENGSTLSLYWLTGNIIWLIISGGRPLLWHSWQVYIDDVLTLLSSDDSGEGAVVDVSSWSTSPPLNASQISNGFTISIPSTGVHFGYSLDRMQYQYTKVTSGGCAFLVGAPPLPCSLPKVTAAVLPGAKFFTSPIVGPGNSILELYWQIDNAIAMGVSGLAGGIVNATLLAYMDGVRAAIVFYSNTGGLPSSTVYPTSAQLANGISFRVLPAARLLYCPLGSACVNTILSFDGCARLLQSPQSPPASPAATSPIPTSPGATSPAATSPRATSPAATSPATTSPSIAVSPAASPGYANSCSAPKVFPGAAVHSSNQAMAVPLKDGRTLTLHWLSGHIIWALVSDVAMVDWFTLWMMIDGVLTSFNTMGGYTGQVVDVTTASPPLSTSQLVNGFSASIIDGGGFSYCASGDACYGYVNVTKGSCAFLVGSPLTCSTPLVAPSQNQGAPFFTSPIADGKTLNLDWLTGNRILADVPGLPEGNDQPDLLVRIDGITTRIATGSSSRTWDLLTSSQPAISQAQLDNGFSISIPAGA